jgi:hypothetical protein
MVELDKKRIVEEAKKRGLLEPTEVNEYHTLVANGFIKPLYDQWKKQCIEQYNDVHWVKIWTDHLKAQAYDSLVSSAIQHQQTSNETEENDIPLIGDGM